MTNGLRSLFLMFWCVAWFGGAAAAQTIGEGTTAASGAKLSQIDVPAGARLVKENMSPPEVREVLAKLVAQGGAVVRQGRSEVLLWGGDYRKASGERMIKSLEQSLRQAGWEYELAAKEQDIAIFTLARETPSRRALVGFFAPTGEAFIFAVAEMLPANAASSSGMNAEAEATEEPSEIKSAVVPAAKDSIGDASIFGKWSRGTGSGFIDGTGKTRYRAGETIDFEFFPGGKVVYTKTVDVLTAGQCRITGGQKANGTFSTGGGNLTIELGAMRDFETNSCDSSKNYDRTLEPSSVKVEFRIARMNSMARPDNPWEMCFNGKTETCYEKVK